MLPVDSFTLLTHLPYTLEQLRVIKALKERRMFKLICGASYSDFAAVRRYSELFARAGAHVINVCAHPAIVTAAKEGIAMAKLSSDKQPAIMISVSLDHKTDPRFQRVVVDQDLCDVCGACVSVCPTQAFSLKEDRLGYEKEKCFGCGACLPNCHVDAFSLEPVDPFDPQTLPEMWELGARCIEVHVGSNFYWLEPYVNRIKEISPNPWLFSVFLSGYQASYQELQEQAAEICHLLGEGALINVDGTPMSGYSKNDASTLRALASAQVILESDQPVFLQISGGVNDRIRALLNQFDLKVHGIGMGSFARKLVDPYLNDPETAVAIARKLVSSIRLY